MEQNSFRFVSGRKREYLNKQENKISEQLLAGFETAKKQAQRVFRGLKNTYVYKQERGLDMSLRVEMDENNEEKTLYCISKNVELGKTKLRKRKKSQLPPAAKKSDDWKSERNFRLFAVVDKVNINLLAAANEKVPEEVGTTRPNVS